MNIQNKIRELEYRIYTAQQELEQLKRDLHSGRYSAPTRPAYEHRQRYQHQPQQRQRNQSGSQDRPSPVPPQQEQVHTDDRTNRQAPRPETDWEHLLAKVWLPRIFIFVLIIGVLWGFTAAITSGLITEPVRVIIGLLTSIAMTYLATVQLNHKRPILGHVLLGGAIAIATLSVFAGHMLYDLFPLVFAFILYAITYVGGIYAGLRYHSQTVTIIAAVGGFLIPFLVGPNALNVWVFALYEALFSVALLYISLKYRYVAAYYVTFFSLHLAYLFAINHNILKHPFMIGVILQHVVLLSVFYINKKLDATKIATLYVSYCFGVGWLHFFYDDPVEWILLGASIVYSLLAYLALEQKRSIKYVLLSIATFSWFMYFISMSNITYLSLIFVIQGTLAYWVGQRYKSLFQEITGLIVFAIGVLFTLAQPIKEWLSYETLAWIGMIVCFYAIYQMMKKVFKAAWVFLAIDSIFALALVTQLTVISTKTLTSDLSHLFVSFVWILYAIAIVAIGLWQDKKAVRLTGILFLFFTLLKVIFYDLPDVSIGIRAILFITLGLIGLIVSRFFYKTE